MSFRKGPGEIPDLIGKKFGKLTVIAFSHSNPKSHCICRCECGKEKTMRIDSLQNAKSCGCLSIERSTTHGMSKTKFYNVWRHINGRCKNVKNRAYKDYGERGIKVEWNNFDEFKTDMYDSFLKHLEEFGAFETTIERLDNNGNYSKNNCIWATRKEQANNRRSNVMIEYNGIILNLKEWANKFGMNPKTFYTEIYRGWEFENLVKYFLDKL